MLISVNLTFLLPRRFGYRCCMGGVKISPSSKTSYDYFGSLKFYTQEENTF